MQYVAKFSILFVFYSLWLLMRFFRGISLLFLACLFLGTTFALFSADDFIAQFTLQQATLSPSEKKVYYKKVLANLNLLAIRNRSDDEQIQLYDWLKAYVNAQMQNLQSSSPSSSVTISFTLSSSGMTIPNVDLDKVRSVWLALHNTERETLSLAPFVYSSALEKTSSTWAQHLADIRATTHRRKNTDGYYRYESIKSWFINQWVVFATSEDHGQPLFTENIWWNLYACKKSDCTDDFIAAIKKSRTLFMKEKGKSYKPHYNAIVGDFSRIGLWVALVGNKYYLVTHYTQDLK